MRTVPACLLLLLISSTHGLRAQSAYASISGGVTNPSKAVIADAKVGAADTGTNFRYGGATNNSGEYYLTNLPSGPHRVEIEKTVFEKLIKPDVMVPLRDALEINFEMTLGSGSESIKVEAGAPHVRKSKL